MKGDLRKEVILVLTFVAVGACAVLLVFALQRLMQVEKDMSSGFGENLMWALAQAQYEQQALALSVDGWNAGARSGDDAGRLELQFDLAASRLTLLGEGTLGRGLSTVAGKDVVVEPLRHLSDFEAGMRRAVAAAMPIPDDLVAPLLRDAAELRATANRLMLAERENTGAQRERYRRALLEATVAIVFIFACGAFVVARLLASARAATRAEEALRRDRDFSHLLLESSGDGVVAFDRDLRCTHWNSAMGEVFPVPGGGEIVGRLLPEAFHLPEDHVVVKLMRATLAGESIFMDAHPLPARDRYIEKASHPLRSGTDVIGGIMIVRDVTEAHLARLEVIEHRDRLEVQVENRTRDLQEALARERGLRELYKGFVSMVSHQFRTPLSIVDSGAQRMMRRGAEMDGDEIRERAGRIRAAALRLTRLVTTTLNAAKLDAGQIDVSMRRCDLAKLVLEACERQKETAPERDFHVELDALPTAVPCDPLLMEQVLTNLLSNAVKYSSAPAPIEVVGDADEAWVRLSVRDRGIGIPPEEHGKLFERFFRASTATGIEGTGIGLHVARTIARLHGGDVDARPREGGGSTFVVSLPREGAAAA